MEKFVSLILLFVVSDKFPDPLALMLSFFKMGQFYSIQRYISVLVYNLQCSLKLRKGVYLTSHTEIVSCNFQQKTELPIKIGWLDLRQLKQDKMISFTY